jgi:Beta-propeller repeat
VTGYTLSTDFPTSNPLQPTNHGSDDAFVAAIDATGATLLYSTYLGGGSEEYGEGIAVDSAGNAYVTGYTQSTNFPTSNPLQPTNHGSYDAFVAKIAP